MMAIIARISVATRTFMSGTADGATSLLSRGVILAARGFHPAGRSHKAVEHAPSATLESGHSSFVLLDIPLERASTRALPARSPVSSRMLRSGESSGGL